VYGNLRIMSPSVAITAEREYHDGALVPKVNLRENPAVIRLTTEELVTGVTEAETIQVALKYFHQDGFVCLENAIPDEIVDKMYDRMCEDNNKYANSKHARYIQGEAVKNMSQKMPLLDEYVTEDMYANKHLMSVIENVLGPKPELRFVSSNVAVGGATMRQAIHADSSHAVPDMPFGIVVNIFLNDTYPENGATEIWLGTHEHQRRDQHVSPTSAWIREDRFQERAKVRPPLQPTLRKGTICIRDLRLWHSGMPNLTIKPRIMTSVDYFAQWYRCPMRVSFPKGLKSKMETWDKVSLAGVDWIEDDIDYLSIPYTLNLTQDPKNYKIQTEKGTQDRKARETGVYLFDAIPNEHNWYFPEEIRVS
jgi:hypothetical protein